MFDDLIAAAFAALTLLAVLMVVPGGLGWLLFKRSQVSVVQLLVAVFMYGLLLTLAHLLLERGPDFLNELILCAVTALALVGVGLFIGTQNARLVDEKQNVTRWILFITGMIVPITILPAIIMLFVPLVRLGMNETPKMPPLVGFLAWFLLILPSLTTMLVQICLRKKLGRRDL